MNASILLILLLSSAVAACGAADPQGAEPSASPAPLAASAVAIKKPSNPISAVAVAQPTPAPAVEETSAEPVLTKAVATPAPTPTPEAIVEPTPTPEPSASESSGPVHPGIDDDWIDDDQFDIENYGATFRILGILPLIQVEPLCEKWGARVPLRMDITDAFREHFAVYLATLGANAQYWNITEIRTVTTTLQEPIFAGGMVDENAATLGICLKP